jgi:multidrug efflux system membrane fusion protein
LWPGEFVNVRLDLALTKNAILVTSKAVNEGPKGRYVWLVKQDRTVEMTPVKIDRRIEGMDVVAQGLSAGDRVISEGQLALFPGAKVITRSEMERMTKGRLQQSSADNGMHNEDSRGAKKP